METTLAHEQHAQKQRDYFATGVRPGMLPEATPYILRHVDELLAHSGIAKGSSVLDIGCGMGRFSFLLAERGYKVESLDVSQFMIDRLREFEGGRYGIRAWCADLAHPPKELLGRFDAVVGFFMLHHFVELDPIFPSVEKLLRPGGKAAFIEPNPYNPLYYIQVLTRPDMKWAAEKGMVNLRRGKVFEHMRKGGLENPGLDRYGFFPPFVRNTSWGGPVESVLESVPGLKPVLPFQVFTCQKPVGRK